MFAILFNFMLAFLFVRRRSSVQLSLLLMEKIELTLNSSDSFSFSTVQSSLEPHSLTPLRHLSGATS
jgi:hypothetical protein